MKRLADKAAQEKMIAQPFDRQSELDEKRARYEYVMGELNKTEQQFANEDETDGKVQYQSRDYWIPNLTHDEWQTVNRIKKQEAITSNNFIDEDTKWLYNDSKGKTVFGLYSPIDANNPTLLYASTGEQAKTEMAVLNQILSEVNDGRSYRSSETFDKWAAAYGLYIGGDNYNILSDVYGGKAAKNDGLDGKQSERKPSRAFINCLFNNSNGRIGLDKNNPFGPDGDIQYSQRVDDEELVQELENSPTVTVYRAMQVIDGKLYPPMAAKVKDQNGKNNLVEASEFGVWYQATERPDLIKNGKFKLDKANGRTIDAAYNPYFHASRSPLNDQFSSAYKRENLVTVEGVVPASELTSGYKAEFAKDAVGEMKWHNGPVSSKLPAGKERRVILSRWFKPLRIVPDAEVARTVSKMLEGTGITVPKNVVTPSLRTALEEEGVQIQYQDRTEVLTDRDILSLAASDITVDNLDAAEKDALEIFKDRLVKLDELQTERREIGRLYKEQQFGASVDRAKAAETLEKMRGMDAKIQEAEKKVLSAETAPALRSVLPRARRIVEQKQRERDDETLRRWRDRRNNAAAIKKYRQRIQKDVKDISDWIISPSNKTDMNHVPDALKSTVIPFITSIDFTSKRQLRGGEATKADADFVNRLKAVRGALRNNITENGLYSGYSDLPPDFMERLDGFISAAQAIVNTGNDQYVINQMTAQELKQLSDIVKVLKKHIQDFNRFHANAVYQHVYDAGDATIRDLHVYKDAKSSTKAGEAVNNFVFWQQIRPAYAFERFGSGGMAIYDGLRRGQATLAFDTRDIISFTEKAYTEAEVRNWEKEVKTIPLNDGTVRMKVSQIMSFYELLKRKQAQGHIFGQGIRVSTFYGEDGKISDTGHTITREEANRIISELTPRQIEVADALQKYMQEKGGQWGNYVSVKRFGEQLFGEEHYFPINSDGRHLEADAGENPSAASLYALLNMGFTKKLQEKANNRLILYSIFDVFSNHMASMAQYHSMALPVLDALKWFNYQQKEYVTVEENGKERVIHEVKDSVRDQLDRVYGVPEETRPGSGKRGYAENFFTGIIKAFNGTETQGTPSDAAGLQSLRMFNMSKVAYNLRVVVQQPMSITRAATILDYDSIIKGMGMSAVQYQKTREEMLKYSGIAAWKDLGFYDTNISRGLTDMIKRNRSIRDKIGDVGMAGAEFADNITWAAMWYASREQVRKQYGIKPGDDAFYPAVTKLFEDVVYKTQVVDSVLTKNEYLRSKGFFARATGSFMSEPTTTASMLVDAIDKYRMDLRDQRLSSRQVWERNGKNIGKTVAVYSVSAIILAAVQAVMDAFRDDDKYQEYGNKLSEAFIENVIDELNPFNKLPIISDLVDVAKNLLKVFGVDTYGYQPQSVFLQFTDPLIKGAQIIHDKLDPGSSSNYTWYGGIYKLLDAASGMTGLPLSPITREAVTIWNNTIGAMAPSMLVRQYAQKPETEIKYTFLDGNMNAYAARNALIRDAGMTPEDADKKVSVLQFQRDNREYADMSESEIRNYLDFGEPAGIESGLFFDVWAFNSNAEADKDQNGNSISGSKKAKVLSYIDEQNLTNAQKDAFYYAFGWSEKTIDKDAPWR